VNGDDEYEKKLNVGHAVHTSYSVILTGRDLYRNLPIDSGLSSAYKKQAMGTPLCLTFFTIGQSLSKVRYGVS